MYVTLLQFIMAAVEATRVRPPATLVDYLCMLHVLTDVRSSRALRLWSASQFRRQIAAGSSGTQLSSALEHSVLRETTGAAQREWKWSQACAASRRRGAGWRRWRASASLCDAKKTYAGAERCVLDAPSARDAG